MTNENKKHIRADTKDKPAYRKQAQNEEQAMSSIKLFESKKIRSVWNELEHKWYFVVEDVIAVLTDSSNETSHTYNEKVSEKIYNELHSYLCLMKNLMKKL